MIGGPSTRNGPLYASERPDMGEKHRDERQDTDVLTVS
jgi:hypothetical protein